jgi:hypothetical protein
MPLDNFETTITAFRAKLDADILGAPLEVEWSAEQLQALGAVAADWASRQAQDDPQWRAAPKSAIFALTEGIVIGALAMSEAERESNGNI